MLGNVGTGTLAKQPFDIQFSYNISEKEHTYCTIEQINVVRRVIFKQSLSLNPTKSPCPHPSQSNEMLQFPDKLWYSFRRASSSSMMVFDSSYKILRSSVSFALNANSKSRSWLSTLPSVAWSDKITCEKFRNCSGAPAYALYTSHTSLRTPGKSTPLNLKLIGILGVFGV